MYEKFLNQITDFIFVETPVKPADMIFVPGNGYPQMAEQAARLWKDGLAPWVLPSGRYSILSGKFSGVLSQKERYEKTYETEWEFLKDVLVKNGVKESCILREEQASYTYENAIYSRQVTEGKGLDIRKGILCCKNYHARRCLMYYQLLFPETEFFVAPSETDGITRENWHKTKQGIQSVLGEMERCGSQFHQIIENLGHENC